MSPEAQRIAIAEACGWEHIAFNRGWIKVGDGETQCVIPDYLNDLNAMHEAVKVLGLKYDQWTRELRAICERDRRCIESATAAQRAEAFLRSLGKWEEEAKP